MRTKTKKQNRNHTKIYTYDVTCSFDLEYSFTESEIIQDPEGGEGDFIPTDEAINDLENRLKEVIGNDFYISNLQADVESEQLLGIAEE